MKTIRLTNLGRFGNQLFRYAHARALAEQNGYALKTEPWVGEKIFTLDSPPNIIYYRPDGTEDLVIDGYCQNQQSLIYSRADCRRWFKLRPEVESRLHYCYSWWPHAHFRRGDYVGSDGYPLISRKAVDAAVAEHLFPGELRRSMNPGREYIAVSDDTPTLDSDFTGDLSFLPDFYRLMRAPVLFRANSSFSWWAATLSHGRVFSPVITGLAGGVEHDNVPYVPGNHPRLCELDFVTDLHLKEQ